MVDFRFHIASLAPLQGSGSRRRPVATPVGRALVLMAGAGLIVVAAVFFFAVVLAALAAVIAIGAGRRLVVGRRVKEVGSRMRDDGRTIDVTAVKSAEPVRDIERPAPPIA